MENLFLELKIQIGTDYVEGAVENLIKALNWAGLEL